MAIFTVAAIAAAWILLPWQARGYGLALEALELPAKIAMGTAPLLYATAALAPMAAVLRRRRTVVIIGASLGLSVLAEATLLRPLGIGGVQVAAAMGQAMLVALLWRTRALEPAAPPG